MKVSQKVNFEGCRRLQFFFLVGVTPDFIARFFYNASIREPIMLLKEMITPLSNRYTAAPRLLSRIGCVFFYSPICSVTVTEISIISKQRWNSVKRYRSTQPFKCSQFRIITNTNMTTVLSCKVGQHCRVQNYSKDDAFVRETSCLFKYAL